MVNSEPGLEAIWPPGAVERFRAAWIESPFQLVAIAQSPEGVKTIAELAELSLSDVSRLVDKTRRLLTDSERAQLSRSLPSADMPLGALKPKP